MIPPLENNFGKITAWSLIDFLNYSLLSYLVQLQILVISLYFFLCIQNGCSYCVYLRKCVRLDLQTASLGLVKTFQDFGFLTLEIFSLSSTSQYNCGECQKIFFCSQNRRTCIKHKKKCLESQLNYILYRCFWVFFIHSQS